jgi:hypothetical protein
MSMNMKSAFVATALIALGSMATPQPARAGDVTNAVLACFVETNANDQYKNGICRALWRGPGSGPNPSVANFKVLGLSAGNYSYTWIDLETGLNPGCGASQNPCVVPIATETANDGFAELAVTVRDLATGATKTVTARAFFIDGYN